MSLKPCLIACWIDPSIANALGGSHSSPTARAAPLQSAWPATAWRRCADHCLSYNWPARGAPANRALSLTSRAPLLAHLQVGVLIVGAGPTGLGAATRLHQLGHPNWLLCDAVSGRCRGAAASLEGELR